MHFGAKYIFLAQKYRNLMLKNIGVKKEIIGLQRASNISENHEKSTFSLK